MYRSLKPLLVAAVLLGALGFGDSSACRAVGDERAAQIIEATGIHGGLVVHLGCGDGSLTAEFGQRDGFLVHGLDRSAAQVDAARRHVQGLGLYGKVSIDRFEGERLPYVDNLVNLLIVEDGAGPAREEILRALAPQGVAYIRTGENWEKLLKPRPAEMDEWTHYLYDAAGNAVSRDSLVGPPKHLQWVGSPRWSRHHDHMASMSAMVSAGGRVFYIFDEGSTRSITFCRCGACGRTCRNAASASR